MQQVSDEQCSGAQYAPTKGQPKSEPWGMVHTPFIDLVGCACMSTLYTHALAHYQGLMQMVTICMSHLGMSHDWLKWSPGLLGLATIAK